MHRKQAGCQLPKVTGRLSSSPRHKHGQFEGNSPFQVNFSTAC
jgi:hypothetical protein